MERSTLISACDFDYVSCWRLKAPVIPISPSFHPQLLFSPFLPLHTPSHRFFYPATLLTDISWAKLDALTPPTPATAPHAPAALKTAPKTVSRTLTPPSPPVSPPAYSAHTTRRRPTSDAPTLPRKATAAASPPRARSVRSAAQNASSLMVAQRMQYTLTRLAPTPEEPKSARKDQPISKREEKPVAETTSVSGSGSGSGASQQRRGRRAAAVHLKRKRATDDVSHGELSLDLPEEAALEAGRPRLTSPSEGLFITTRRRVAVAADSDHHPNSAPRPTSTSTPLPMHTPTRPRLAVETGGDGVDLDLNPHARRERERERESAPGTPWTAPQTPSHSRARLQSHPAWLLRTASRPGSTHTTHTNPHTSGGGAPMGPGHAPPPPYRAGQPLPSGGSGAVLGVRPSAIGDVTTTPGGPGSVGPVARRRSEPGDGGVMSTGTVLTEDGGGLGVRGSRGDGHYYTATTRGVGDGTVGTGGCGSQAPPTRLGRRGAWWAARTGGGLLSGGSQLSAGDGDAFSDGGAVGGEDTDGNGPYSYPYPCPVSEVLPGVTPDPVRRLGDAELGRANFWGTSRGAGAASDVDGLRSYVDSPALTLLADSEEDEVAEVGKVDAEVQQHGKDHGGSFPDAATTEVAGKTTTRTGRETARGAATATVMGAIRQLHTTTAQATAATGSAHPAPATATATATAKGQHGPSTHVTTHATTTTRPRSALPTWAADQTAALEGISSHPRGSTVKHRDNRDRDHHFATARTADAPSTTRRGADGPYPRSTTAPLGGVKAGAVPLQGHGHGHDLVWDAMDVVPATQEACDEFDPVRPNTTTPHFGNRLSSLGLTLETTHATEGRPWTPSQGHLVDRSLPPVTPATHHSSHHSDMRRGRVSLPGQRLGAPNLLGALNAVASHSGRSVAPMGEPSIEAEVMGGGEGPTTYMTRENQTERGQIDGWDRLDRTTDDLPRHLTSSLSPTAANPPPVHLDAATVADFLGPSPTSAELALAPPPVAIFDTTTKTNTNIETQITSGPPMATAPASAEPTTERPDVFSQPALSVVNVGGVQVRITIALPDDANRLLAILEALFRLTTHLARTPAHAELRHLLPKLEAEIGRDCAPIMLQQLCALLPEVLALRPTRRQSGPYAASGARETQYRIRITNPLAGLTKLTSTGPGTATTTGDTNKMMTTRGDSAHVAVFTPILAERLVAEARLRLVRHTGEQIRRWDEGRWAQRAADGGEGEEATALATWPRKVDLKRCIPSPALLVDGRVLVDHRMSQQARRSRHEAHTMAVPGISTARAWWAGGDDEGSARTTTTDNNHEATKHANANTSTQRERIHHRHHSVGDRHVVKTAMTTTNANGNKNAAAVLTAAAAAAAAPFADMRGSRGLSLSLSTRTMAKLAQLEAGQRHNEDPRVVEARRVQRAKAHLPKAFDYVMRLAERGAVQFRVEEVEAALVDSSARDERVAECFSPAIASELVKLLLTHAMLGDEAMLRPFQHARTGVAMLALNRPWIDENQTLVRRACAEAARQRGVEENTC